MGFSLSVIDYVLILSSLIVSAAVGLYIGFIKKKNNSANEYFMASNELSIFKIACSTFSTIVSSGLMVGLSAEIYYYGIQPAIGFLFYPFLQFINMTFFFPIYYKIGSPDMFTYYELRFFRSVRYIISFLAVIELIFTISIVVYGAAITMSNVSGINYWLLIFIITIFCAIYSSLGGVRGVSIADTLQGFVIIVSVFTVIILGIINVGGIGVVWKRNYDNGRTNINLDFDLTIRNTLWSATFGRLIDALALVATNQTIFMRMMASKSPKHSRRAAVFGSIAACSTNFLCCILGLIIYATFYSCDPVSSGITKQPNQLLSVFIEKDLSVYTGLAGIFFAGFICAAVSTVSSVFNGVSALIMETFVKPLNIVQSESKYIALSKISVIVQGVLAVIGISFIEKFSNLYQAFSVITGVRVGPQFALLIIGTVLPQANKKCAVGAFGMGIVFMLWLAIGSVFFPPNNDTLPVSTQGCQFNVTNVSAIANQSHSFVNINDTEIVIVAIINNVSMSSTTQVTKIHEANEKSVIEMLFPLSKVSFTWFTIATNIFVILVFILLSIIFGAEKTDAVNLDLIPKAFQRLHKNINNKWRKWLLCDVYKDDDNQENENHAHENINLMDKSSTFQSTS